MPELEHTTTSPDACRQDTFVSRATHAESPVLSTVYGPTQRVAGSPRILVPVRGWVKHPHEVPAVAARVERVDFSADGTAIVLLDGGLDGRIVDSRRSRAMVLELPAELLALLVGGAR